MLKLNSRKLNRHHNKGFTLVELVVVLALMAILLSTAAVGIIGWVDWAQFKQQNATAEDIFYAVQNQLTELDSSGAMYSKVQSVLWDNDTKNYDSDNIIGQGTNSVVDTSKFASLLDEDGNSYNWDTVWKDSNKDTETRTILKLSVTKNRYTVYANDRNDASLTVEERLLFDLIAPYVSDKSVLNGSISIEFSPEAAQVFSVCYSDKAEGFKYGNNDTNAVTNAIDITDREIQTRQELKFGYFGVDSLTRKIKGRVTATGSYILMVRNGNSLDLLLDTNKPGEIISGSNLVYTVYGSPDYSVENSNYSKLFTFSVDKNTVDGLTYQNIQEAIMNPVEVDVMFLDDGLYDTNETHKYKIPMWKENNKICLSLDAVDIQAQSFTYATAMGVISDNDAEVNAAKEVFENTYSFYRFGFPRVRFIRADVDVINPDTDLSKGVAESGDYVTNYNAFSPYGDFPADRKGAAVTFANYYESAENGDTANTYGISNVRHLYNVRFESDYSDAFKTSAKYESLKDREREYVLRNSLDWVSGLQKVVENGASKNYFFNSCESKPEDTIVQKYWVNADKAVDVTLESGENIYAFPGFRLLSYSDSFASKEDINVISNVGISLGANCEYGVYGKEIKNTYDGNDESRYSYISNIGKAGAIPIGLFAENFGLISDVELQGISVAGIEEYAIGSGKDYLYTSKIGGFVGENFGTVRNLYIDENVTLDSEGKSSLLTYPSRVRGRFDVGGIVGHQYSYAINKNTSNTSNSAVEVTISGCKNNAKVTGMGYVGGIIGRIYPEGKTQYDLSYDKNSYAMSEDGNAAYYSNLFIKSAENISTLYSIADITKFTIDDCMNRGEISIDEYYTDFDVDIDNNALHRGFYYGGITGAAFDNYGINENNASDANYDKKESAVISNCTSYTLYSEDDLKSILNPDKGSEQYIDTNRRLRANFVGGLVGGSRYAYIKNCSTTPDKTTDPNADGKYSFVFGDRYVGGVIGYSVETFFTGGADYTVNELKKLTSYSDSASQTAAGYRNDYSIINGTGAYGNYAVGGISGAFGRPLGKAPGVGGSNTEVVKNVLETAYNGKSGDTFDINTYSYPIECAKVNSTSYKVNGLLNTAVVLGGSYNDSFNVNVLEYLNNTSNTNVPDNVRIKDGQLFYGVGGITGILAATINNADNIQTEETKLLNIHLVELGFGSGASHKTIDELRNISMQSLKSMIDDSDFVTDGVGGLVGLATENGNINLNKSYKSKIDAVVIGRNRVGGAVGDVTTADHSGESSMANMYPSKIGSGSTGMTVVGYDNVGGLVGVFDDNGDKNSTPGLNASSYYDGGSINTSYYVIGERAVGGIIGTCKQYKYVEEKNKKPQMINCKISCASGSETNIRGSLYVGGIVGIQEGFVNGGDSSFRYFASLKYVKVEGDVFAGGIAGAIYGSEEYFPLDHLVYRNNNRIEYIDVKTNYMASSYVTGLYALNLENSSVLFSGSENGISNNYRVEAIKSENKYENSSNNGLYQDNVKDLYNDLTGDYSRVSSDSYIKYINILKNAFPGPAETGVNAMVAPVASEDAMDMAALTSADAQNKGIMGGSGSVHIVAPIYTGGLFAFSSSYLPIRIINFRNRGKLEALTYIKSKEAGNEDDSNYSYLGAVTGKIPRGMIVEDSFNSSADHKDSSRGLDEHYMSPYATFKGGLAEINAGTVINCTNPKIGNSSRAYVGIFNGNSAVGNMIGLNGTSENTGNNHAVIENCTNSQDISGGSVNIAGGIAASIGGNSIIRECHNAYAIGGGLVGTNPIAGGIVAYVMSTVPDNADIQFINCVNEESVSTNNENRYSAGIAYNTRGLGVFKGCRNYSATSRYAITSDELATSSTENKCAKSILYCFDGSDLTQNWINSLGQPVTRKNAGFGGVVNRTSSTMKDNFYLGGEPADVAPVSDPTISDYFMARSFYSKEGNMVSASPTWETDSILNVSDISAETAYKEWSLTDTSLTEAEDNKISFEIISVNGRGEASAVYSDINSLGIVWNNRKAQYFNGFYPSDDEYKNNSDYNDYNDFYTIAIDEYGNKTSISGFASYNGGGIAAYVDADNLEKYAYAVFEIMQAENTSIDIQSAEAKTTYINLLYEYAYFMDDIASQLTVNYSVKLYDINGHSVNIERGSDSSLSYNISGSYSEDVLDINSISSSDFDADKIKRIIITVDSLSADYGAPDSISMRAVQWVNGNAVNNSSTTTIMHSPTGITGIVEPFAGKNMEDSIHLVDEKALSLTNLYKTQTGDGWNVSLNGNVIDGMISLSELSYSTLDGSFIRFINGFPNTGIVVK